MDNTNIVLAANIQKYRKEAVSKWENAKSVPDILLLPIMADLFGKKNLASDRYYN